MKACSVTSQWAPGAAGVSCASASRSPTSASRRCCAPATASTRVITADAYGAGEADTLLGRALAGVPRAEYALAGAVGHDFYEGERDGAKGFPRFTDPRLRGPGGLRRLPAHGGRAQPRALRGRLLRPAAAPQPRPARVRVRRRSGRRCASCATRAWRGALGVAPGPANGFTLDMIGCFERYGELIDWAMLILNPFEPWPGELALGGGRAQQREGGHARGGLRRPLPRRRAARARVRARRPPRLPARAAGSRRGASGSSGIRPIADRHGLTPLQLACAWNLAHDAVECVAPTLIQEPGAGRQADRAQARGAGGRAGRARR